ncbi:L-ribulose-5-phosphate 3-epimerase [Actinomyces sp. Marseille-P3109]|jgi:L-ribulose-5-phosphate 3-epimerase ulaE|uniref:L-ribulose-5-phosphate 3-epimerase n=1 Tax=Actinomyces sp. Marseille-P3109 TaxID=2083009 RepID=UPI000D562E19|nr:L-ribulose-5-phosphate 3-epimerase [Actinomyces sp. Marseille-P3109]
MSSDAAQADTARAGASAELKDGVCLGIYEKALRSGPLAVSGSRVDAEAWRVFLDQVPRAGFSFLDLSIDESPEREARLDWDAGQCRTVRRAAEAAGTFIGGICLSLHRRIGPGSADPDVRRRAREVMARGLQVCHDLGVPVIQLAGYYCYYEDPNPDAERWYAQLLADAVPTAARLGVVMGIENVDGDDVTSLTKAMEFVDAVDSPYLQLYPDLGNIAEQGLDPGVELAAGEGHMVAMHAKDVRPGEPRRVEMGAGVVDWDRSFALLAAQGWSGRLMIEMWNDDAPDSLSRCAAARTFIEDRAGAAGLIVEAP